MPNRTLTHRKENCSGKPMEEKEGGMRGEKTDGDGGVGEVQASLRY